MNIGDFCAKRRNICIYEIFFVILHKIHAGRVILAAGESPARDKQYGMNDQNEIVLYQPNELTKLEVRLVNDTVWLSQQQMAILFGVKENNITYHIKEIYKSNELPVGATAQKIRVVRLEGNRQVERSIDFNRASR